MKTICFNLLSLCRPILRLVSLILSSLLVLGCSSLQVAYFMAGSALQERAKAYLDLSPKQEVYLELQSAALIKWHRKNMLPKYATFFWNQANIVREGGWSRQEMAVAVRKIRLLLDETVEGASHFIAEVLVDQTTPDKIAFLEAQMSENLAKRRIKDRSQTLEDWVESRTNRIARFTGPLNRNQTSIIRAYAARNVNATRRWLDNREQRQAALVAFLRTKPTKDGLAGFVYRLTMHAHEIVDPAYRAISEARWAELEAMHFKVFDLCNNKQRDKLISVLRNYALDMTSLADV